jgi:para-aminobenzoate synthetase
MPSRTPADRILFVDAFDSFSNNIVSLLETNLGGVEVTTVTINFQPATDWPTYLAAFNAVVIGPGPGTPLNTVDVGCIGQILDLSEKHEIPVLGICLGFQCICMHYGANLSRLQQPRHGVVSNITHRDDDIFENVGSVSTTLYHSLCVRLNLPAETNIRPFEYAINSRYWHSDGKRVSSVKPLAWLTPEENSFGSEDGAVLMAVRIMNKPIWGLQFHPESCYSNSACIQLIRSWWSAAQAWNTEEKREVEPLNFHTAKESLLANDLSNYYIANGHTPSSASELSLPLSEEDRHACGEPLIMLTKDISEEVIWTTVDTSTHSKSCRTGMSTSTILEICGVPQRDVVVLESRAPNGRFTIISMDSPGSFRLEHTATESTYSVIHGTSTVSNEITRGQSIFDLLSSVMDIRRRNNGPPELPFWGGFMGFFGYNMGREKYMTKARTYSGDEEYHMPDMALLWVERSIVIDHQTDQLYIQSIHPNDSDWMTSLKDRLTSYGRRPAVPILPLANAIARAANIHYPDEESYKSQIRTCQHHNAVGDSYELCLTTECCIITPHLPLQIPVPIPWILYRALRTLTPARYAAFLQLSGLNILSASPERFLSWTRSQIFQMRPMKGTVKKSPSMTLARARSILESRKEIAENLMIADLIRHDMHGVVGSGNVSVEKLMLVEEHARVYQMVTVIKGSIPPPPQLPTSSLSNKKERNVGVKMLQSTLSPGSMTGAPKKRSIELLDSIENRNRGVYAGVLGYLDIGGGGDWSVIIRSAFKYPRMEPLTLDGKRKDDVWRVGAGGAVTCLSEVEGEWEEMRAKLDTVLSVFRHQDERDGLEEVEPTGNGGAGEGWGLM